MNIVNLEFKKTKEYHYNNEDYINCKAVKVYSDKPFDENSTKMENGKYQLFHSESLTNAGEVYNALYNKTQTDDRYLKGVDFKVDGVSFAVMEKGSFHLEPNIENIKSIHNNYFEELPLIITPIERLNGSYYINEDLDLGSSELQLLISDASSKDDFKKQAMEKVTEQLNKSLILGKYKILIDDIPVLSVDFDSYTKLRTPSPRKKNKLN